MAQERFKNFDIQNDQMVLGTNKNKVVLLNANNGEVIWEKQGDQGMDAAPIFGGTAVFVGSFNGEGTKTVYTLTGLDLATGNELWERKGDGAFWYPRLYDRKLYAGSTDKHLYAVDPDQGEVIWKFEIASALNTGIDIGAGNIYIGSQGTYDAFRTIHAVHLETGEEVWSFDNVNRWLPKLFRSRTHFNSPIFFDGIVYVTGGTLLFALDAKTGKKKWTQDYQLKYAFQGFHTQCINEKYLCMSSSASQKIIIVDPKNGETLHEIEASSYAVSLFDTMVCWSDEDGKFHAFDLEYGETKWSKEFPTKSFVSPIVHRNQVYLIFENHAYCLNMETGEEVWSVILPEEAQETE